MTRIRGLPRRFRFPWRTLRQIHREVDEELFFHLDRCTEDLHAAGLPIDQARREAHRQFGNLAATRRQLKAEGRRSEHFRRRQLMFGELFRDIGYAWRSLARSPAFTTVAVLVLTLGISVNTAIFSVLNMMLMRPIMIEDPEALTGVYSQDTVQPDTYRAFSYPSYVDIREQNDVFTDLAAYDIALVGLREDDTTRRLMAGFVSANYFKTLGVPIARGRGFLPSEEEPGGGAAAAVVSDQFWHRYGGGADVLGSTLHLNGHAVTVVGVAPEGFSGTAALVSPHLWLPLGLYGSVGGSAPGRGRNTVDLTDRRNNQLLLFGRLKPGIGPDQAKPQLEALGARLEAAYPAAHENQTFTLSPLSRLSISTVPADETRFIAPSLLVMAMGVVVLLIACLNLANMFLARGARRRTELAIRLSLGGGRFRLLRQLLSEGLVLSFLGGAGGLVLAFWGTRLLVASLTGLIPLDFNIMLDTGPDLRVLAATLAFCVLATLLSGLGPAWKLVSEDVTAGLKEHAGQSLSGSGKRRVLASRNLLVVAQIALSLVLLSAGGLFMRGAFAAADQTPGFSLDNSVLVELDTSLVGYDDVQGAELYRRVVEHLRSLPGIEAASLASIVPFGSVTSTRRVLPTGQADEDAAVQAHRYIVGDEYFQALRLPILRGRDFTAGEASSDTGPRVAIIDEPLAELLWPDAEAPSKEALGKSVRIVMSGPGAPPAPLEVVGVVPGVRHQILDHQPSPHLYQPFGQQYVANMHLHLRLADAMQNGEAAMLQTVREEIRNLDARLPVLSLKTLRAHRDESLFLWLVTAAAKVFSVLGFLALFLALVGIYGVKTFVMAQRTREIGIRMAVGARRADVLKQMLRESLTLTISGLVIGVALSAGTAKLLSSLIYETHRGGTPLVLVGAASLLAGAATLAAYLPAKRATKIEPVLALRHD